MSFSRAIQIRERVTELVEPVLEAERYELIDAEWVGEGRGTVLRLYIDSIPPGTKEQGVSVDDCQRVSRVVGDLLDVEDAIPGAYRLEVSSPGLFRPLTKAHHFSRELGSRIKVKTFEKKDGRRTYTGLLEGFEDERLTLSLEDGQRFTIQLSEVAKANLEPLLEF
ncbi:MAG: ribosome maturation factor RimP [Myxococcota bacterium]